MQKVLLLLLVIGFSLNAQFKNKSLETKFDQSIFKKIQAISDDKKIAKSSNAEIKKKHDSNIVPVDDNGRLLVRLNVKTKDVKNSLISLGCEIKNEGWDEIYVWVPYDKFESLAGIDGIKSIVLIPQKYKNTEVVSQGYFVHYGDYATDYFSLNGSGIKVGVISDGMQYYQDSQINGDLPPDVGYVDNSNTFDGAEGTAMMEIIHDFAPNAALWFGGTNNSSTPLDFANRITHLGDAGCKIIVDDISWGRGYSYFVEREISTAINQFIQNKNGCYISSVGNFNGKLFSSNNYTVDNSTKIVSFSNNNITFQTPAVFDTTNSISITLQWADSWSNPSNDFDIEIRNITDNEFVGSSNKRGSGFNPEEFFDFYCSRNKTYSIKITWFNYTSTSVHPELKVLVGGLPSPNLSPACTTRQVFGHQKPKITAADYVYT